MKKVISVLLVIILSSAFAQAGTCEKIKEIRSHGSGFIFVLESGTELDANFTEHSKAQMEIAKLAWSTDSKVCITQDPIMTGFSLSIKKD